MNLASLQTQNTTTSELLASNNSPVKQTSFRPQQNGPTCPDCDGVLIASGGCFSCFCGFSMCS